MPSTTTSKRQIAPNSLPSRKGLAAWVEPYLKSTVGAKQLVAATGLILTAYVIVHMLGNLQVFFGPDAINVYAESLKKNAVLLWTARGILLAAFATHIGLALWLNAKARQARPIRYAYEQTVQATFASRHMVITGLLILIFTIYHICHYTLGITGGATVGGQYYHYHDLLDERSRPDVYSMVIYGFSNPVVAAVYIVAQVFLFLHLTHGVASMFQTLGLSAPRAQGLIRRIAWTVALVVCLGNIGIVAGVWAGAKSGVLATTPPPPIPDAKKR
jgi:succinate dehydrogenase / fumarate reductase cytochrome b subunit